MDHPTHSRYPDFNVLDKWMSADWDEPTREVVRNRLRDVPPRRFFSESEARLLTCVADRIVPQPDRQPDERVPIVPWIDAKLHSDQRDGYRYDGMPPQRVAWRGGLCGIDETAVIRFDAGKFAELSPREQDEVLRQIEEGNPPGRAWRTLPAARFFSSMLCATIVKIYYAHPYAWNEVGYNGPSSPRGHMRIWEDGLDPWEAQESGRQATVWTASRLVNR